MTDNSKPVISFQQWELEISKRLDEDKVSTLLASKFDIFKLTQIQSTIKKYYNVLHQHLQSQGKIFIFGAGGTTSWFLPKLLKIYNDAFHKVPNLKYDLEIVLIDADVVRI